MIYLILSRLTLEIDWDIVLLNALINFVLIFALEYFLDISIWFSSTGFNKILKSSIIKYDFNSNFLEILFEALNNENSKFILIGCDIISWNSINIICDLAKKNNKKILELLEDVVPSNFDYSDYGERTTGKVKKIYANLEGRNKNLEIVSREVFINEKN